ncbi:MAG: 50S ribosomal protein L22 [Candidatus Curtissbacteria bacterium GW2011_GWA1_40_9]|uniref:Large ribosomal subunit protein uL22 n=1 Tax=Candidatus Curtissbacteria bacterium GW2011_GWA1_40_9 TaxID=1618408 RepID=A0A0G0W132_9BACT|nr:MAG: 50S ribosomal protein L22 [Candidatus Curtissbacteria bacterium GW2011_GWA1_40_9]
MEIKALANNIRISPQKVRLVVAQIKKMKPQEAIDILEFVPQKAAKPLKKAIGAAIANAKNNFNLDDTTLIFREINVGKGMVFKRYRPISRGRAHSILRQTSNIRIVLSGEKTKKVAKILEEPKGQNETKVTETEKKDEK